jgi:hypothetical protein
MTEYPTREEWEARKAGAPAELLALAASAAEQDADRRREDDERWASIAQQLADHRARFEGGLACLLALHDGNWLTPYRVDDETFHKPYRLDLGHRSWLALFDLSPVGFHPIQVELVCGLGGEWYGTFKPFGVVLPPGTRWVSTLAEAVRVAAQYQPCPF